MTRVGGAARDTLQLPPALFHKITTLSLNICAFRLIIQILFIQVSPFTRTFSSSVVHILHTSFKKIMFRLIHTIFIYLLIFSLPHSQN